jgi:hypothetical protein
MLTANHRKDQLLARPFFGSARKRKLVAHLRLPCLRTTDARHEAAHVCCSDFISQSASRASQARSPGAPRYPSPIPTCTA